MRRRIVPKLQIMDRNETLDLARCLRPEAVS